MEDANFHLSARKLRNVAVCNVFKYKNHSKFVFDCVLQI